MAIAGVGTALKRWNGSSWAAIAEVTNIDGPGFSRETIDTTALDTSGGYRTFITGFRQSGTITFSVNYTRSVFDDMKSDFDSDTEQNYTVVLSDSSTTTIEFKGFVTEMPLSIPPDDTVTMDVTIQLSGDISVSNGEPGSPTL